MGVAAAHTAGTVANQYSSCPSQLQRCALERVVVFHSLIAVHAVYGSRNVHLTPWMISEGKISGVLVLVVHSFEKCLLRWFGHSCDRLLVKGLVTFAPSTPEVRGTFVMLVLNSSFSEKAPNRL